MIRMLRRLRGRRLFRRARAADARCDAERYRSTLPALETRDEGAMRALAQQRDTAPEVLYYLAADPEPAIRRAVAQNQATPIQADQLLCGDSDDSVRCALAQKIGRLVPDLDQDAQEKLYAQAVELLERLANDHLPQVRRIVAEEIKHCRTVPRGLVRRLAHDVESVVCTPVLEYSPLLQDEDLIEIIAATTAEGALNAIARRDPVGDAVSDAIFATVDIPAVAALLANPNARIRAETLDQIVEQAESVRDWHAPLVMRAELSLRAVRRIAGFIGSALVEELVRRHGLEAVTAVALARQVRARLREAQFESLSADAAADSSVLPATLDDDTVTDAVEAGRADLVTLALAQLAGVPTETASSILATRNGRAITALVWKAGLGMRVAVRLQQNLLRLPPGKVVNARDGLYYPLTREEMILQLELFGIACRGFRSR
jgi:uncharacterized protein (DUF2336 family)